jgi:TRAP-type C4-dicarboxylate transport system substrate-binding protein
MEDLKGLCVRAPSAQQAKQLQAMGAVPIAAPITEVYPGLERGTMDGAMVPFTTILDFRLGEVAKGFTIAGPIFGRSAFLIVMNQKKYDSLPPAARAAIDKLSGRALSLKATEVYIKRAEEAVKSVRDKADVVTLSAAEQSRIGTTLRPIIDEWIKESESKGIPARDMLKRAGYAF